MKKLNLSSINSNKLYEEVNALAHAVNGVFFEFHSNSLNGIIDIPVLPEFLIKAMNQNNDLPFQLNEVDFNLGKPETFYLKGEEENTLIRSAANLRDIVEYLERSNHIDSELEKIIIKYCNALSGAKDNSTAHNAVCDVYAKAFSNKITQKKFENIEKAFTESVLEIILNVHEELTI